MHSPLKHISDDPMLDFFAEPVIGEVRLAGMFIALLMLGLVVSTLVDLNPAAVRSTTNTRVINGGRVIYMRAGNRYIAKKAS